MDLYGPKEFDDPQVFDDPKGISIGSMNFDNPKVYGDTSIFDGLICYRKFYRKFWPILANLGYFVANIRTFWCTFTGLKMVWCPKIDK